MPHTTIVRTIAIFIICGVMLIAPATTLGAAGCYPVIDHFEVTQAIQSDLCQNTPCFAGDVPPLGYVPPPPVIPIVAARSTAVRMYMKTSTGCSASTPPAKLYHVTGFLHVGRGMAFLPPMSASNRSITVHQPGWNREKQEDSLNFTLFLHDWGDKVQFIGLIDTYRTSPDGPDINCTQSQCRLYSQEIDLTHKNTPTMLTLRVRYQPGGVGQILDFPDETLTANADSMLWAIWPLPDRLRTYAWQDAPSGGPLDPVKWAMDSGQDQLLTDYLEDNRLGFKMPGTGMPPDKLYALFRGNPFLTRYGGSVPPVGFGTSEEIHTEKTIAHEHGHMIYDAPDVEGVETDEVGFDVLRRIASETTPVKKRNLMDVMVSSVNNYGTWIAPQRYVDALSHAGTTSTSIPPVADFYPVGGTIDVGGNGTLNPTIQLSNAVMLTQAGGSGDATLRLVNGSGSVLYETAFPLNPSASTHFKILAPALPDAHRVELRVNGGLQDSIERTANAPIVAITAPQQGQALTSDTVIHWNASDVDGDPLRAYVLYSHDGGDSWMPLSARVEGSQELPLTVAQLPSGNNAMIRVLVSDGLNTTSAEVGGLSVPQNRAPRVSMASPIDGSEYWFGSNVVLQGSAFDPEDGWIGDAGLDWYETGSFAAALGTGPSLNVSSLAPGVHQIHFRATDSQGLAADQSVTITVIP